MNSTQRALTLIVMGLLCFFVLTACGAGPEPEVIPPPTLSPDMAAGLTIFESNCAICHALVPDVIVRGPSLHGISERGATRVKGTDARSYVYSSILRPADFLVEGYENIMPSSFAKDLTGEELDLLVNYLLTFDQEP